MAPYESLNLGDHVGDDMARVIQNREKLASILKLSCPLQTVRQVHDSHVFTWHQPVDALKKPEADAIYTRRRNVPLCILTADCLPIFLINKNCDEIAVIHGGWRSLAKGIIAGTLDCFQSATRDILAYLGAAIGPEHFVTGAEVRQAFIAVNGQLADAFTIKNSVPAQTAHKNMANIYQIATILLQARGVEQIYQHHYCTYRDAAQFFSYRRDGVTGRMGSILCLR